MGCDNGLQDGTHGNFEFLHDIQPTLYQIMVYAEDCVRHGNLQGCGHWIGRAENMLINIIFEGTDDTDFIESLVEEISADIDDIVEQASSFADSEELQDITHDTKEKTIDKISSDIEHPTEDMEYDPGDDGDDGPVE